MSKVIIIGAGLSGLSAAVNLIEQGHSVKIIEKSKIPGGRVKSIYYDKLGYEIDYGKHLMLGCYKETLEYLKKINSYNQINIENKLNYKFYDTDGSSYNLKTNNNFYPLNLLMAIFNFNYFSSNDKIIFLKFLAKLFFITKTNEINTEEYLIKNSQYNSRIKNFWDLMIVSIFNTTPNKVSANLFIKVIKEIFLSGNKGLKKINTYINLSDLLVNPALKFIEDSGNNILLNESVLEINIENKIAKKLITNKNEYSNFDYIVFATDYTNAKKIILEKSDLDIELECSQITNIFVELKNEYKNDETIGLFNNKIDWIFISKNKVNLVISNSHKISDLTNLDLQNMVINLLENLNIIKNKTDIQESIVQRIPKSTTIIDNRIKFFKKKFDIVFKNIFFCGDWLNYQLPSTIESAIKSGKIKIKKM